LLKIGKHVAKGGIRLAHFADARSPVSLERGVDELRNTLESLRPVMVAWRALQLVKGKEKQIRQMFLMVDGNLAE
jgi:hypothetical protein